MDFIDMMREYGITEQGYRNVFEKLFVLRFGIDRKGDKIVSQIDGEIVFVDRNWAGDRPGPGETWFCRVTHPGTAYLAEPLMNINSSFMDGLSEDQRRKVVDAVWEVNRGFFENEFEKRYAESVKDSTLERLRSEHRTEVDSLKARIVSLEAQIELGKDTSVGHTGSQGQGDVVSAYGDIIREGCDTQPRVDGFMVSRSM